MYNTCFFLKLKSRLIFVFYSFRNKRSKKKNFLEHYFLNMYWFVYTYYMDHIHKANQLWRPWRRCGCRRCCRRGRVGRSPSRPSARPRSSWWSRSAGHDPRRSPRSGCRGSAAMHSIWHFCLPSWVCSLKMKSIFLNSLKMKSIFLNVQIQRLYNRSNLEKDECKTFDCYHFFCWNFERVDFSCDSTIVKPKSKMFSSMPPIFTWSHDCAGLSTPPL